jgi:Na+/melibiose symporter-like transporter
MGVGTSLLLIAVGAILKFAVTATVSGVDVQTVGLVLMVVGAIGLVLSLFWTRLWVERRPAAVVREPVVGEREVVREREVL